MGGFASAIGGAGGAAQQYGQQVRALLESRRHDFADLIGKAAEQEIDPSHRSALLGHQADLLAGKPIGKIAEAFSKTIANRQADDQALQGIIGEPPKPPAPVPGLAQPGQSPGTLQPGSNAPTPGSAAQPNSNPLQGGGIPGLPAARDNQAIFQQFLSLPQSGTPAGRAMLAPYAAAETGHNETLRQDLAKQQATLAYKRAGLESLKSSPMWGTLPDFYKASLEAEAAGMSAPNMPAGLLKPLSLPGVAPSGSIPPEELVDKDGNLIDPKANPFVRQHLDLLRGTTFFTAAPGPMTSQVDSSGAVTSIPNLPGAQRGQLPALVANQNLIRGGMGVTGNGNPLLTSFSDLIKGNPALQAPGVDPSFIPLTSQSLRNVETMDEHGNPVTKLVPVSAQSQRGAGTKTPPSGVPLLTSGSASSAAPATPAPRASGQSFPRSLSPAGIAQVMVTRVTPLREASAQLFGDPTNPSFPSLRSFGDLADSPGSRQRIGTAMQLIMDGMDAKSGGALHGGVGGLGVSADGVVGLLQNWMGLPSALAASKQAEFQKVLTQMTPRERQALDSQIAALSTVVGLRKLTGGQAAKYTADSLDREVPMIGGPGTKDSKQFYNKLSQIAVTLKTGAAGVTQPEAFWRPGELDIINKMPDEMLKLSQGLTPLSGNEMINVQIPGQKPGQIHKSQWDNFFRANPGAQRLQ